MKKNNHYVYVYLDPRKPGNYTYFDQGIGVSFDFEPFYIGEGKDNRINAHLEEAKKENSKDSNIYKLRKIRKILASELEPIIYKICENMNQQDALNLERTLGFLIGRYDQKRGPLTNLADCGGKTTNISKESKMNQSKNHKKTLENDPTIIINSIKKGQNTKLEKYGNPFYNNPEKIKQTYKNDPSIRINQKKKEMETKNNDPSIMKNAINKGMKTKKENPEKVKEAGRKQSKTKKEKPEIVQNAALKQKETKSNKPWIVKEAVRKRLEKEQQNPEIRKTAGKKIKEKTIKEKTHLGRNNGNYTELNIDFIIKCYFQNLYKYEIINLYEKKFKKRIWVDRVLDVLAFPKGSAKDKKKIALKIKFIEENKHRINWYIENYKRLEEEYFENKWKEKYIKTVN